MEDTRVDQIEDACVIYLCNPKLGFATPKLVYIVCVSYYYILRKGMYALAELRTVCMHRSHIPLKLVETSQWRVVKIYQKPGRIYADNASMIVSMHTVLIGYVTDR